MFVKGQQKLHAEIDLLHIIKQLRTASFASSAFLKPHQAMLVKWFDKYKVSLTKAEQEDVKPDLTFKRTESMSFDPYAVDNLISNDADSDSSSSDED